MKGDRETLVLLPGLVCDQTAWTPLMQRLPGGFDTQVVLYDLRDNLAEMARHVLASVPAEQFSLAGHSMGGRVAFEVWRQAPHRVRRLALLDTSYHPLDPGVAGENEKAGRYKLLDIARREGMRAMAAEWAKGMVHPSHIGGPVFEAVLDMFERSSVEAFAAQIKALLERPDAWPLLSTITVPVLLLCGREDGWSPPSRHEAMQQAIAGSVLEIVERCGHMSTMEQPGAVASAFEAWLLR
jgi:pimeloyl-ACP methyl ester carboxylesterase